MIESDSSIILESSRSIRVSLETIHAGNAGLNNRRMAMLNRVPQIGDSATFNHEYLQLIDLAYLSAKTGHEFAILRGKDIDILFHGNSLHCEFPETLVEMMIDHKVEIIGHSHPGEDDPIPSSADRAALIKIGQKNSFVVSGRTGKMRQFGQSAFDVLDL
ncbi:MAG: hypothetical protein IKS98_03855 [Lachnospiraceae bacterium]|nr:hypothetical protein [Lachnospiraceae bacterium]